MTSVTFQYVVFSHEELYDIEDSWAKSSILECVSKNYMNGYGDGTFKPLNNITILETCTVLSRIVASQYEDWFFANKWDTPEQRMKLFYDLKVIDENEFVNINRPILREELAKLITKTYKLPQSDKKSNFSDDNLISIDKRGYVNKMRELGIFNGADNKFSPLAPLTRAEFCAIILRLNPLTKSTYQETGKTTIDLNKQVPILLYHSITDDLEIADSDPMYVTIDRFKADLDEINAHGYTPIFAKDLDKELPPKPIVITFDDGYLTNYEDVFPVLKEYNMKMTIFLNGYTGDIPGFSHKFTWEQAKEMVNSGLVDIQSHTKDLHSFSEHDVVMIFQRHGEDADAYMKRIKADCELQNKMFLEYLGYAPTVFAYPYGQNNPDTEAILKQYYKCTLTTESTVANPSYGLYLMPRITIIQSTALDFLNE